MLKNYVILALRTLLRNKTAFIINLFGMSIALGCCIAAYVNYEFNTGFDKQQVNASDIYRVSFLHQSDGKEIPYGVTPMALPNLIRENNKEVDQVVRYISKNAMFRIGGEMFQRQFVYADPNFAKVFSIEMVSGLFSLTEKSSVLISDKLAETYYGKEDPIGMPLTQIISGEPKEFVVGGVFRSFPFNSSFRFDLITTFDNYFADANQKAELENDWKRWTTTFLHIRNKSAIEPLTQQLQQYVKPQNDAREDLKAQSFFIEPFVGMSNRALRDRNQGHWLNMPMPPAAVVAPFAMAGFLLLVACFNFTNNSIAVAGRRLKEIGIRKVIGGKRKELIVQFLAESLIFCMMALVLSLFLAEFFVAGWDAMWPSIELSIQYRDNNDFFIALFVLMISTALLAGSYPAFYISSFKPIHVLKGTARFGGTNVLTRSLLVLQFSISLAAVIFALAFYFNSRFQKSYDLGYTYQNVVQVPVESAEQFVQLKNALAMNPDIHAVGGSEHHIYSSSYKTSVTTEKAEGKEIDILNVGDDYFRTVNVRILLGREFEKDRASDLSESIIVNQEFVKVFNLGSEPIGKRVLIADTLQAFVIGVVKDVYLGALFQPLAPVAFRYVPESNYRYLVASTDPGKLRAVHQQVKDEWKKLYPNVLYTGRLMEERMVMALEHFDNVVILYTFLGFVAIVMSVSGLFSLVSLNLQKRTKELGIRKILGAPLGNLTLQASKMFLIVMFFSFILGSSLGAFFVNKLMDSVWEYYVAIDFMIIVPSVLILFIIASLTVGYRIFSVALTNPAESLRYE